MKLVSSVLLCISSIYFAHASNLEHDNSVTIRLQHTLIPYMFTERGNISISSLRLGQSIVHQKPLTSEEQNLLRDLSVKNGLYQIKAHVSSSDGSERTFISTIKACMLAEAQLDDRLSISIDYAGRVIGVSIIIASKSTCEGAYVPLTNLKQFTSNVYVRQTETGPIPDTATFIEKIQRENEAKERGEVKDNRSFLAKYYLYIIPVVVIMVLSSATTPDPPAQ